MEQISFKLEVFEGPLDLLLSLISKNKVNIYDIPISLIFDQYMEYINNANEAQLEITADFMAMAATLIYIKSKMLLPVHNEEEEEDPRELLVRMLVEYKRYKEIADKFSKMQGPYMHTYVRLPAQQEFDKTYEKAHDPNELKNAFEIMCRKAKRKLPPPPSSFKGIVGKTVVSVSSRVVFVLRRLLKNRTIKFKELFYSSKNRSEVVATFLAVLELLRDKNVVMDDDDVLTISRNGE